MTQSDAAETEVVESSLDVASEAETRRVNFAFDRAPWRDVIKWIADESGLALQFEDLPPGSFSYTDPKPFTVSEAIDRINLFLLPQGYTLVRSRNLLSVINLGDSRSLLQLDALARLVMPDQLGQLSDHEVVKCVFALGELKPNDAVQELSSLNLMTTPAVLEKTNRLIITDTAAKLRNVQVILEAFQPKTLDNGTVMRTFTLDHVKAEDILSVARPHLGLATGEMIGIDVSLSSDLSGENIFVTGVEDKVKLVEGLIESLDKPQPTVSTADGQTELRAHYVAGENLESVYNVLQTLLAGRSLRLSMDEEADSIVALATPDIHAEIDQTISELQASEADFEVIPLRHADPYFVISLLEEMLDLPDEYDDPDEIDPDAPKIDADPGMRRLFVRGKASQIEQIKKIVSGLDTPAVGDSDGADGLRVLPISGRLAEELIESAAKFWQGKSPIILLPSSDNSRSSATERTLHTPKRNRPERGRLTSTSVIEGTPLPERNQSAARMLSDNIHSQAPPIRCQITSQGLLLQSQDTSALDQFEDQLRTLFGRADTVPSPPIVYYLKYVKPEEALRMLAELLDGGEMARTAEVGSLVNGIVGSSGSYLGSIVTSRDGTSTMMSGSITVVADSRLNRLIAQGTPGDIATIESYLKIIDKDKSITSVETYGTSHVIELAYTSASEVAATIQAAYAGRVSGAGAQAGGGETDRGGRGEERQRERRDDDDRDRREGRRDENRGGGRGQGGAGDVNREPQMTIAVHEPSNSLIVTAPDQLFREVEKLAKSIDSRSEQSVAVVPSANAALLQTVLAGSDESGRSQRERSSSSERRSSSDGRRAFAEALRNRFGR